MSEGKGVITQNDLMQKLVHAKKVMNKVDGGDFERGHVNENTLRSPDEMMSQSTPTQIKSPVVDENKIRNSKLPDVIKQAMIENPIPQIALTDSLDMDFVKGARALMEKEGLSSPKQPSNPTAITVSNNDLMSQLTPLIENIVRKTVTEIMDTKLNQILTAQQTASINENLVLKVGDSIFKGKITGVNKSK